MAAPNEKPGGQAGQFAEQGTLFEPPPFCPQWPSSATKEGQLLAALLDGASLNHPEFGAIARTWRLAAACRGAGLVVVDTLNRAAPGVDENSSQDMGRIIEAAADLQRRIGGLVLLVHHAGKDATKGMRGHSSLHAALDAAIEVRRDGDAREWRIAKSKDGADAESIPFRLEVVTLGLEADGTPLTSCAVVPVEAKEQMRRALPPKSGNQRIVWDALPDVLKRANREGMPECVPAGTPCINVEAAIDALRGRLPCEAKRQTERAQQALTGLAGRGLLHIEGGWLWLA